MLKLAQLPVIHSHVVAMPDAHVGKGAPVGAVIPTIQAIIPAAVGVDIGCGMIAAKTSLNANDLPASLRSLRLELEAAVPVGVGRSGSWKAVLRHEEPAKQLGTLGSGNHFICALTWLS